MATNTKATTTKAEAKRRNTRTRNWSFILYPESAPQDWKEIIDNEMIPWICSPLHDKDVNPTGEPKKAHYHILLLYPGVKSFAQIEKITTALNAPIPQQCSSAKGLVRYMAHLDNPEKHQYNTCDIVAHNGADLEFYLAPTSSERNQLLREMSEFITDNNIIHFADFWDYAAKNRPYDWFPVLTSNGTYNIMQYIKSNWQRLQKLQK